LTHHPLVGEGDDFMGIGSITSAGSMSAMQMPTTG